MSVYYLACDYLERQDERGILDLVTVALVHEDGAEYHAICNDFMPAKASVREKREIIDNLPEHRITQATDPVKDQEKEREWRGREVIKIEIIKFLQGQVERPDVSFWGFECAYDYVVFCQIFGGRHNLADWMPTYCGELRCKLHVNKDEVPRPPKNVLSLERARWCRDEFSMLI